MIMIITGRNFPTPNSIAGATNWMEYELIFNSADDVSPECLSSFSAFKYYNKDGTVAL
jgi:hypothetical protein